MVVEGFSLATRNANMEGIMSALSESWTEQRGGLWLRKQAVDTGKRVAFYVFRNMLAKAGIDRREVVKHECPMCGGIK